MVRNTKDRRIVAAIVAAAILLAVFIACFGFERGCGDDGMGPQVVGSQAVSTKKSSADLIIVQKPKPKRGDSDVCDD